MNSDKKKMLILGGLALVMIAVGAFSFMGGGGSSTTEVVSTTDETEEPAATTESEENTELAVDNYGEPRDELLAAMPYEVRDPFSVPTAFSEKPVEPPKPVTQPVATPPVQPNGGNSGSAPFNPNIGGTLPPLGATGGTPELPVVTRPMYSVKGIMLGSKPLAVFEDGDGNQKLVPIGGSIDGDTKVVAIEKGKVTVSRNGKQHTLVIDEEARND